MDENEQLEDITDKPTETATEDIKDAIEDVSEDLYTETARSDDRILEKLNDIHVELVRLNAQHVTPTINHVSDTALDETKPALDTADNPQAVELTLDTPSDIPKEEKKHSRKKALRRKR